MFYFVIFCKFLITSECGIVFGRQGPEVRTEEREALRQTPKARQRSCRSIFSPRPNFLHKISELLPFRQISRIDDILAAGILPDSANRQIAGIKKP